MGNQYEHKQGNQRTARQIVIISRRAGAKIYVTRQTISNWENDKSYPDIHSLILLSAVFDMTIDNLVKGDVEIMEKKIEEHDIRYMKRYGNLSTLGMYVGLISFPLLVYLLSIKRMWIFAFAGGVILLTLCVLLCYWAYKLSKIRKKYDIQAYREVVAFLKGETLDEITKTRERKKWKYQQLWYVLYAIVLLIITFFVSWWILAASG